MSKTLREAFSSRYQNLLRRSEQWGKVAPDKDALWQKLQEHYENGFRCYYCHEPLVVSQPFPSQNVFSFDHGLPFAQGGDNNIHNIVICCHACNIIKGTMKHRTFECLLKSLIPFPGLKQQIFIEIWRGRLADKIDRVAEENLVHNPSL